MVYTVDMDFTDQVAVVTGASGQLGRAIALALAERGLDCICHYYTHKGVVDELVTAIEHTGRRAVGVRADLADPAAGDRLFEAAAELPPVRVLINSASVFERQPVETLTKTGISKMLSINLTAPLLLCSAFARYLKRQAGDWKKAEAPFAAMINLVDVAAVKPWAQYSAYSAARAGLVGATKSLAKELAPGITVNAVAPGIVTWRKMDPSDEDKQLKMIPVGRFGDPKDVTRAIDFLLDSPYITGQTICIDGGRSL